MVKEHTFSSDELKLLKPEVGTAKAVKAKAGEAPKKKTGPNQPCACGSGLKTKKCPCVQSEAAAGGQKKPAAMLVEDETVVRPGDDRPRDAGGKLIYDRTHDSAANELQMREFSAMMKEESRVQGVDLTRLDT